MYPAYKREDVINEYAISFFTLLEEGYALRYQNLRRMAQLFMAPEMKPEAWRSYMDNLEVLGKRASDILIPDDDYSGIDKLKQEFKK